MKLERFQQDSPRHSGGKTALVVGKARLTYAELDDQANRLARVLRQHGVNRGDRVVIFLDNSVEAVVSLFATAKAGAVFCIVNPTTKTDKLAFILNNCQAKAVITHAKLATVAADAIGQAPSVITTIVAGDAPPR